MSLLHRRTRHDFRHYKRATVLRQMRIKRFTPRATDLFALLPGDVGRPLLDITHRLGWETVTSDAEQALSQLRPIERETRSLDGRHIWPASCRTARARIASTAPS